MISSKQKALDNVALEIEECKICQTDTSGMPVPGEGSPDAVIVFVGEAPGRTESKTGRPFIGRSGQLLRSLIRNINLREELVFITSPVKYLPNNKTPNSAQIRHGRTHLVKQLAVIKPQIIVLLGNVAIQGVLNQKQPIMKVHGKVIVQDGQKYFLTLHPSAALRFPSLLKIVQEDFTKLKFQLPL